MATDTAQRKLYEHASISDVLDHGSISFGRYAAESLKWEKWSTFPQNRCKEELEKFKFPGFVARKKAYFEEYYRKIKALKALQTEQQETIQFNPCQDEQTTVGVESRVSIFMPKDVGQLQFSGMEVNTYDSSSKGGITDKLNACNAHDEKFSLKVEVCSSIHTVESENSVPEPSPLVSRNSGAAQQDFLVSTKLNAKKPEDHSDILKAKVKIASLRDKQKSDVSAKRVAVRPSEKLKPSLNVKFIGEADGSLIFSKRSMPHATNNIKSCSVSADRQLTKVCPRVTALHPSFAKDKAKFSSSSIKGDRAKEKINSKSLTYKIPTKLLAHAQYNLFITSISKEIIVTGGNKNTTQKNRICNGVCGKPMELSSNLTIPKGGRSENQISKLKSTKLTSRNKLNQSTGRETSHRGYSIGGKEKEGKDTDAVFGRDTKHVLSNVPGIHKFPNSKLDHKIASSRYADLMPMQKEPRYAHRHVRAAAQVHTQKTQKTMKQLGNQTYP